MTNKQQRNGGSITLKEYSGFQHAYDYFNAGLFDGSLPEVLVTLQRKANTRGYFAAERFSGREQAERVHELALNPDTFDGRSDREILSTLVHEMCHVWQQEWGDPPRRCYHDKEWAEKMVEIGLQPTDTGEPGGRETGQRITHFIIDGGAFDKLCARLLKSGYRLNWQSCWPSDVEAKVAKKKTASKTKYSCPECGSNAWAKPGSRLLCGNDDEHEEPVEMDELAG